MKKTRLVLLVSLVVPCLGRSAWAAPITVVDVTYSHDAATTRDSHRDLKPAPGTPTNWRSPIDYAAGTAHMFLEVLTKPSNAGTKFQICFSGSPSYACTDQSPTYTTTGIVRWPTAFSCFFQSLAGGLEPRGPRDLSDSPENVGATRSAHYMPTRVRMVVTLVAPGEVYVPPGPAGARPDADGAAAGDGGSRQPGGLPGLLVLILPVGLALRHER